VNQPTPFSSVAARSLCEQASELYVIRYSISDGSQHVTPPYAWNDAMTAQAELAGSKHVTQVWHERWEHGSQLAVTLAAACDEVDRLTAQIDATRKAAQVYAERVEALGLAADDNDPRVMATAEPIGAAQADLYAALGLLERSESGEVVVKRPTETVEQLRAERDAARMLADVRGSERDDWRNQVREWEALGIRAEEMRERLDNLDAATTWPPSSATQVCGWCVHAAGDTQEAWLAADRYTLEDMRRHALVCEHHPLVQLLTTATAHAGELQDRIDSTCERCQERCEHRITKEAGIDE
jgi:hypothetical protein